MRMDRRSEPAPELLARNILEGKTPDSNVVLGLAEFEELYKALVSLNNNNAPRAVIINLVDQAFVLFPEYNARHLLIEARRAIKKDDFRFLANLAWYGADAGPQS